MVIRWREKTMIKVTHNPWAKLAAVIVCILSGIVTLCSVAGIGIYYFGMSSQKRSTDDLQQSVYVNLSQNYAAYMLQNYSEKEFDALDGGNLLYSVVKVSPGIDGSYDESKAEKVYSNNNYDVNADDCDYLLSGPSGEVQGVEYEYSVNSMWQAIMYSSWQYWSSSSYTTMDIDSFVFDYQAGKMYAKCGDSYVFQQNISVDSWDKYAAYSWNYETGAYCENGYEGQTLDASDYSSWYGVNLNDSDYIPADQLEFVSSSEIQGEILDLDPQSYTVSGTELQYETEQPNLPMYYVYMKVEDVPQSGLTMNGGVTDYYAQAQELIGKVGWFLNHMIVLQIVSAVIFLASIVFLSFGAGHRSTDDEIHMRGIDRLPYEIYVVLAALGVGGGITANIGLVMTTLGRMNLPMFAAVEIEIAVLWVALLLAFYLSTVVRLKNHCFWKHTLLHYLFLPVKKLHAGLKEIRLAAKEHISLTVKTVLLLIVVYFAGALLIAVTGYEPGALLMFFTVFMAVAAVFILWAVLQMKRLKEGGKRIAQGDYSQPIDTDHMYWEFKKHAENINEVSNGISLAVDARMKSEHFKTELITNVSHDIKTPLTSIINYVDLIKKEQFDDPKLAEYIDVLDRQSARLKKLIEDLMEASKASTGNLPVHLEKFDASVMLTQVVGEFEERTQANSLELIVTGPEKPVYILADGRHLWRVFDNLMSNICKYAQPGTRVYINLDRVQKDVVITFRNISRYQLNITSEELMERFVRGDSSRNTEGNGLGLSIAQSLTTLMNGTMRLEVDGDLFKVILTFAQLTDESSGALDETASV